MVETRTPLWRMHGNRDIWRVARREKQPCRVPHWHAEGEKDRWDKLDEQAAHQLLSQHKKELTDLARRQ